MSDEIEKIFVKKRCRVTMNDTFVLYGIIEDINTNGIILRTEQKTSFISFSKIADIIIDE